MTTPASDLSVPPDTFQRSYAQATSAAKQTLATQATTQSTASPPSITASDTSSLSQRIDDILLQVEQQNAANKSKLQSIESKFDTLSSQVHSFAKQVQTISSEQTATNSRLDRFFDLMQTVLSRLPPAVTEDLDPSNDMSVEAPFTQENLSTQQ